MVIDTSVIVAVATTELGWQGLVAKASETTTLIAAPTVLESHMVLRSRLGQEGETALEKALAVLQVLVVPFGLDHLAAAKAAFDTYGKGRHPAGLNMGDCMTYALAKVSGRPLLYLGNDFTKTDLALA